MTPKDLAAFNDRIEKLGSDMINMLFECGDVIDPEAEQYLLLVRSALDTAQRYATLALYRVRKTV